MGHYDMCRAMDETDSIKIKDKQIKALEKKVKKKKQLIVYDDYSGALKLKIARKSKLLTYKMNTGSQWTISFKKSVVNQD